MNPIVVTIPGLRLVSESNQREHHMARARRVMHQRDIACMCTRVPIVREKPQLPLVVTLTRIAPRALDAHDNLRASFKAVADGVTDALGLKTDRVEGLSFEYAQARGKAREYGVRVEIRSGKDEGAR